MSWRKSVQAYTRCQLYNTKQLFVCYFHQYSSTSTCFSTQNNVKCLYESSDTDLSRRQLTEAVIQLQESLVQCHKVDLIKVPFTNLLHQRENQNTSLVNEQFATFTFLCYQKKKKKVSLQSVHQVSPTSLHEFFLGDCSCKWNKMYHPVKIKSIHIFCLAAIW